LSAAIIAGCPRDRLRATALARAQKMAPVRPLATDLGYQPSCQALGHSRSIPRGALCRDEPLPPPPPRAPRPRQGQVASEPHLALYGSVGRGPEREQ
jgi:hypothetical protein